METDKQYRIAFLFNDFHNEYGVAICKGALQAAEELGVSVVFFGVGQLDSPVFNTGKRNRIFSLFSPEAFDGVVYISSSISNYVGMEKFLQFTEKFGAIPSAHIGVKTPLYSTFNVDNRLGMYGVVDHLIKVHRRKKIAIINGTLGVYEADERFLAYKMALEDNGIAFDVRYAFAGDFLRESGILAIEEFLDKRNIEIDAIVGANDLMALYAMKELQRRGYRIPEDISICGFDDLASAKSHQPALTTVHQPVVELGYLAMKEFCGKLLSGSSEIGDYRLPAEMVVRQSCGCGFETPDKPLTLSTTQRVSEMTIHERGELDSIFNIMARNIVGSFDYEDISKVLDETLILCDIENFTLAKYVDDSDCQIFYSSRKTPKRKISSQRLVSDSIDAEVSAGSLFILPLYYRDEDLGFFITDAGYKEFYVLEVLANHLSGALKGAQLLEDARRYSERLEKEVKLRTNELAQRSADLEVAIDKVKLANEKLKWFAVIDDLTGLFNRRGFMTIAKQNLELAKKCGTELVLVYLDLDGLKKINDTYGHASGDTAIQAMATILQSVFRKSDIIARLGGDEFTVLALDCTPKQYELIANRMDRSVDEYNAKSGHPFTLAVSSGSAHFTKTNQLSIDALLEQADLQLYRVKKEKKSRNVRKG